jgi:hypothetical protein
MHPLFIRVHGNQCIAQCEIPDSQEYTLHRLPVLTRACTRSSSNLCCMEDALEHWIHRRNMNLIASRIGVIDRQLKKIFLVDMVATQNDDIIFICMIHTNKQIRKIQKEKARQYCEQVKQQAQRVFQIEPIVYALNIYNKDKLWSMRI